MILISAMTHDRVIGSRNALPWNIPEEYEHFLGLVQGHPVILGRTSYEIFGGDLSDSAMIVVSSSLDALPDAEVCRSVKSAVERARSIDERFFSAGGATIYRQTLPLADALYLSIVKGDFAGDILFPEFSDEAWALTRTDDHPRFEFRVYERR